MLIDNEAKMNDFCLNKVKTILEEVLCLTSDFKFDNFIGIKIVDDNLLHSDSDGRFQDNVVFLPKNKTEEHINNNHYDLLKSTIYHELCHMDLSNKLPNLHSLQKKYLEEENFIKCFTIMIFIEYIAHIRSSKVESLNNIEEFFNSINNKNWNFSNEKDLLLFIKISPYIIGRAEDERIKNTDYISLIKNENLRKYIYEIKNIFDELPTDNIEDNYNILLDLEKYVSNYITND